MERFATLFERFINNNYTEAEKNELFDLIMRSEYDPALQTLIDREIANLTEETPVPGEKAATILSLILQTNTPAKKRSRIRPLFYWSAAAVALLAIGLIVFYTVHTRQAHQPVISQTTNDKPPAASGALLTLSDGSSVVLDSIHNGVIAHQSGTRVSLQNGQVIYDASKAEQVQYNTLTTPRGRIFQLALPDGTKVWLNAASSLTYPTHFDGNERRVEITGEAYFEVAHNPNKPFIVSKGNTTVQVLGTHFNVNAYDNESAIITTLLEGSVQVKAEQKSVILKPGEQASISHSSQTSNPIPVHTVNVEQVVAWKNGIFNFENADIKTVMRQLERWYNIEVKYEAGVPDIVFGGKMGRDLTLSHILRILQISKVHFRMEQGNILVVTP